MMMPCSDSSSATRGIRRGERKATVQFLMPTCSMKIYPMTSGPSLWLEVRHPFWKGGIYTDCTHRLTEDRAQPSVRKENPENPVKITLSGQNDKLITGSPFASLRESAALSGSCLPSAPLRENQALETDPSSGGRSAPR